LDGMPAVADMTPTGAGAPGPNSHPTLVRAGGYLWRPATDADGAASLADAVDIFAVCIREAASQKSDDIASADRRADLAAELANAFKLHARPQNDFTFLNSAIAKQLGERDDLWDSVVSIYTSYAMRTQVRRAGWTVPVVAFMRYRGAHKAQPVVWQLWVHVSDILESDCPDTDAAFVLHHPVRLAAPLVARAYGAQAVESPEAQAQPSDGEASADSNDVAQLATKHYAGHRSGEEQITVKPSASLENFDDCYERWWMRQRPPIEMLIAALLGALLISVTSVHGALCGRTSVEGEGILARIVAWGFSLGDEALDPRTGCSVVWYR